MKIGPTFRTVKSAELSHVKSDNVKSIGAGANRIEGQTVKLSDLSSKIAELEATLASSPAFDVEKVNAIKQAISEGKFQVKPEVVAEKLLANVREMLNGKTS